MQELVPKLFLLVNFILVLFLIFLPFFPPRSTFVQEGWICLIRFFFPELFLTKVFFGQKSFHSKKILPQPKIWTGFYSFSCQIVSFPPSPFAHTYILIIKQSYGINPWRGGFTLQFQVELEKRCLNSKILTLFAKCLSVFLVVFLKITWQSLKSKLPKLDKKSTNKLFGLR